MASTDAKPFPQKNVAYRVTFPIFDNDGDLVTGAAGLDSEVSKDGAAFADCTNEATEIGSSGIYYLDITSTEMNADTVAVIVKTSTTDAKTTPMVMYPEEAGDIRVNVAQVGGTTQTAGDLAALITTVDDLLDTELAAVKTVVDSILVDTAEIGAAGAGLTALATQASVNTIDDLLDTEIPALTSELAKVPKSDGTASWNATAAAQIQSEVNDALVAYDPPTRAEATSDANSILTAVGDVPTNAELATALGTADDAVLTAIDALPTNAELATALASADDAVLAAIAALNNLSQANIRTALGMASANFDTQIADLPTNAELAAGFASGDDAVLAAVAALNNLSSAQVQTAAAAALTAYDPPTRTEATADKDEIIVQVNANETKIDTLDTVADSIKAKTDSLTFTVAGKVDANVQTINDVELQGTGVVGDPFEPV